MITKITKDGLFAVVGEDFIVRCFKDEETYNKWLEYTTKNGHNLTSLYMMDSMIQHWKPWTQVEIDEL